MGKCLVTTLSEQVNDESLAFLGECTINVREGASIVRSWIYIVGGTNTARIAGDAYFTDSTGTENLGKTITLSNKDTPRTSIYTKGNGTAYKIIFNNKYNSWAVEVYSADAYIDLGDCVGMNILWSINPGRIATGDVANIKKVSGFLEIHSPYVHGDVSKIDISSCTSISLFGTKNVLKQDVSDWLRTANSLTSLNLAGVTRLSGNLSALSGKPLTLLNLGGAGWTGNLSSLADTTTLSSLIIDNNPGITGDTSSLAKLTNLTTFNHANCPNITGTWPLT